VVEQATALLTPAPVVDLGGLRRTFALQTGDLLAPRLAGRLLERAHAVAPHVVFRFLPDSLEGTPALREGRVDLEIGVIDHVDPETRVEPLLTTRMVGAVRPSHPLARERVTVRRFAAAAHVTVSRRGRLSGPVDEALAAQGLSRRVVASVPSYSAALSLATVHDVVTLAPDGTTFPGLTTFEIPLDLPAVSIGMAWHPRNDADPGHRWLRGLVRDALVGDESGH
jgi:DNA-binding transcriptional LysR family regulator